MGWNHRIVKRTWYVGTDREESQYGIYEAYNDKNGKVFAITSEPVGPCADTTEHLEETLKWMKEALKKPILDYDNIPEEGANDPLQYRDHDTV